MPRCDRLIVLLLCAGMLTITVPTLVPESEGVDAASMASTTLIVGVVESVDNLNPLVGLTSIVYTCHILTYDYLYMFDKDFNSVPRAAESWNHSVDGKVWTFNIRHGMTFHDGVAVTANDVNWTFNLILNNPSAGSLYVDLVRNVTRVRALDNYTLEITSEPAKANMLALMIPILPMHIWSKIPANKLVSADVFDTQYFPDGPIGSGAFRLVDYVPDNTVTLTRNPNYYGGTIHFDNLVYKSYINPQAMLADLTAGTIDIAYGVPKDSWVTTLDDPNIDGQAVPELTNHELGFNTCPKDLRVGGASTNYETLNLSVRRAVAMAVDKAELVENALFGLGVPGDVLIPPSSKMWHYNVTTSEEIKFDLSAASALLNASGYIDIDSDGVRENSTNRAELRFDLVYATEYPDDEASAIMISNWLDDIGIRVTPTPVAESKLYMDSLAMKLDMYMWSWGQSVDPTFILSVMTTAQIPSGHNDWNAWSDAMYSNPVYDQLFAEQMVTVNVTERQAKVYEMERILYNDCPYVVTYYPYGLYAYRTDRFTNYPVMVSDAMTPMSGDAGGPWFFMEILPNTGGNLPPEITSAPQSTQVALNETRSFTGEAYDPDGDPLTWTWRFVEPNGTTNVLTGQSVQYTFLNEGVVTVTLEVSDGVNPVVAAPQITITVVYIADAGWIVGYVNDTLGNLLTAATVSVPGTSTSTDSAGYYNMTLASGSYTVSVSKEGYESATKTAAVVQAEVTMLNFSLVNVSGTISGHVYDEDGVPIGGAAVSARMGEISKIATTNDDGVYELLMLPAGTYDVNVSKVGYETNSTTVVVVAGQVTTLDVELNLVSSGGGGLSSAAQMAIGVIVAIVAIAIIALLLMRRKKGAAPSEAPPEQPSG